MIKGLTIVIKQVAFDSDHLTDHASVTIEKPIEN